MCVTRQKSASQTSVLKGGEGTFILPHFDARPVADALEPQSRIYFLWNHAQLPHTQRGSAGVRAVSKQRCARTRKPKMRQNHCKN